MRNAGPPGSSGEGRTEVLRIPAFRLFWTATTIRGFGSAIASVAFQVLIVTVVAATPAQIGILNALGVAPYLFLGFIIGALMDRWNRQRTLVLTSIGRAVVFALIPVLLLLGHLDFWSLAAIMLTLGVLTLFAQSAEQPFVPQIVPRSSLVSANARLGQSETVAGTAGPAAGGALLTLVGAPLIFVFEAVIHAVSAVLQSRIRVTESAPAPRRAGRHIGHDIVEGMRFTYRHKTLRPLALSVHVWFLGNSIVATVFAVFALRELGMPAWAYGIAVAVGGVGGFLGAIIAPAVGERIGAGRAILVGRSLTVVPWLLLAVVPLSSATTMTVLLVIVSIAQFLFGLAMGVEDANDISYRQAIAPDAIQGRMNATIRTTNRIVFFFGALGAGVLATWLGYAASLGVAAAVFAVAALVIVFSPLRNARHGEAGV
ncbi:MFS transporter [Microbacterium sp. 77mftsu3.1]|uniref:MFS transporter n=1 Tax=Microbacterium sp. 77mftsu3.1 TaxID=1761802 RepID=UPI000362B003|nr:MFS transporter [Microbacterium sp. 77mftsu3.1]SDG59989.1 Predicted arabinose efflux permease, MFS family [Microbacterium sp. 77mftsu3.1]